MNLTSIFKHVGLIPDLAQWVKDLAWLWYSPAATALAWKLPYAAGAALKDKRQNETTQNKP